MSCELLAAKKYGLFWARSFAWDETLESSINGSYIYQPDRFWEPFRVLFDKLGQINDYCFNLLVASETKLVEINKEYACAVNSQTPGAEVFDYFSEEIPIWEDNVAIFAKATPVILLASFTEWGLKYIAESLSFCVPRKTKRGVSDIEFYIRHLIDCGLDINNLDELLLRIEIFRGVRNNFMHGRWIDIEEELKEINLRGLFESVSNIFEEVESAAWRMENI